LWVSERRLHNFKSLLTRRVLVRSRTSIPSPLLSMKTTSPRCRMMSLWSCRMPQTCSRNDSASGPATMRPEHWTMVTSPTARVFSDSGKLAPEPSRTHRQPRHYIQVTSSPSCLKVSWQGDLRLHDIFLFGTAQAKKLLQQLCTSISQNAAAYFDLVVESWMIQHLQH